MESLATGKDLLGVGPSFTPGLLAPFWNRQFPIFVRFSSFPKIEAPLKYSICSFQKVTLAGKNKMQTCESHFTLREGRYTELSRLLPTDPGGSSADLNCEIHSQAMTQPSEIAKHMNLSDSKYNFTWF